MEQRCHGCGYRSANATFFRSAGKGLGRRRLCEACDHYPLTKVERQSLHTLTFYLLGAATLGLLFLADHDFRPGLMFALFVLATFLWIPFALLAHESGHALAGLATGAQVEEITIGAGPPLWRRKVGGTEFVLRRNLAAGGQVAAFHPGGRSPSGRWALFLAGGAAGNFAMIALLLWIGARFNLEASPDEAQLGVAGPFLIAGLVTNGMMALTALWPRRTMRNGSDGARLLDLFLGRRTDERRRGMGLRESVWLWKSGRGPEALALAEAISDTWPGDDNALGWRFNLIGSVHGPKAQLAALQTALKGRDDAWLHSQAAYAAIECDDPSLVPAALKHAEKAAALTPDLGVQGVLGAVGAADGQAAVSLPLLRQSQRSQEWPIAKAALCAHLARAARGLGDDALAGDYASLETYLLAIHERLYRWRPHHGLWAAKMQ